MYTVQSCPCYNRVIKGTSQTKLYKKLGLESLKFRRWFRRLCTFFKVKTCGKPNYLNLISTGQHSYNTRMRSLDQIENYYWRFRILELRKRVTKSRPVNNKILHSELLTRWLNFYFFAFELLTRC